MAGDGADTGPCAQAPVFQELEAGDPAQLGSYTLVARLGAGGMGKVFLSHTPAGRPVALKSIRPELADDPEFRRRFRQEVAAAQRVQGLNTAPVVDSDTDGTPAWLATAYVPGPTLAAVVARHGALPVPTVLLLAAGVAEALQAVHAAGIVHRDVKPSNVLLAGDGPRVIDFGISQAADSTSFTNTGLTVGTPAFMSPEQATGTGLGPAIDVFSLGQVVAFAAKGTPAFGAGQTHGVLYRIVHQEPDLTGVPEALLPLLNRCLSKEPDERPSLDEVIDLCRAVSEGGRLARSENWLPEAVAADVSRHEVVPEQAAEEPTVHGHGRGAAERAVRPARRDRTAAPALLTSTAGHPHLGDPTRPVERAPLRSRRKGRRIAVLAGLGVLAMFTVWGIGSGIVGSNAPDSRTGGPSEEGSSGRSWNPDPKQFTYKGIHLPSGYYLQFKDDPLKPKRTIDGRTPDMGLDCGEGCVLTAHRSRIFPLDRAEEGSLATCQEVTEFTYDFTEPLVGDHFCVTTNAGTLALFTCTGPAPQNQSNMYLKFDVEVWRDAFPKDEYWQPGRA